MRKLRLDLESLGVETFAPVPETEAMAGAHLAAELHRAVHHLVRPLMVRRR